MNKNRRGRNLTLTERSILFDMVREGAPRDEVNTVLDEWQWRNGLEPREIPESSYKLVRDRYLPLVNNQRELEEMVKRPPTWSQLKSMRGGK
jgi:hypothetical protein